MRNTLVEHRLLDRVAEDDLGLEQVAGLDQSVGAIVSLSNIEVVNDEAVVSKLDADLGGSSNKKAVSTWGQFFFFLSVSSLYYLIGEVPDSGSSGL